MPLAHKSRCIHIFEEMLGKIHLLKKQKSVEISGNQLR